MAGAVNSINQTVNSINQALSGKANGNGGIYFDHITPRQLNTPEELTNIVASYPDRSLVIISIGWEEYDTFSYAGYGGYIMIGVSGTSSCRAWGKLKNYDASDYSVMFGWVDRIDVNAYTGLYSI